MTNSHGIQPISSGHMDTRSAQGTTVQHTPQESHYMTPQQNAETPKEAPLEMINGCLKDDGEHQQGTT